MSSHLGLTCTGYPFLGVSLPISLSTNDRNCKYSPEFPPKNLSLIGFIFVFFIEPHNIETKPHYILPTRFVIFLCRRHFQDHSRIFFSRLVFILYMRLCVFSLPISLVMIAGICNTLLLRHCGKANICEWFRKWCQCDKRLFWPCILKTELPAPTIKLSRLSIGFIFTKRILSNRSKTLYIIDWDQIKSNQIKFIAIFYSRLLSIHHTTFSV